MENKMKLQGVRLPKMMADLSHSNQFLKVFCLVLMVLNLICLGVIAYQVTRDPLILTFKTDGSVFEEASPVTAQNEIKKAIGSYLKLRYHWDPERVEKNIKLSENFILPTTIKAYQKATENVVRFSKERSVSQKIYPGSIEINLDKGLAFITGDRITSIQGLKAVGNLKLELSFENGPRTKANPWGLYISKEKEEK